MKIIVLIISSVALSGCGLAGGVNYIGGNIDQLNARNTYVKSSQIYKQCLAENPNSLKTCESQRITMELDEKTLSQISASQGIGTNVNLNSR